MALVVQQVPLVLEDQQAHPVQGGQGNRENLWRPLKRKNKINKTTHAVSLQSRFQEQNMLVRREQIHAMHLQRNATKIHTTISIIMMLHFKH